MTEPCVHQWVYVEREHETGEETWECSSCLAVSVTGCAS